MSKGKTQPPRPSATGKRPPIIGGYTPPPKPPIKPGSSGGNGGTGNGG